jgi:hypothetical protein
MAMVRNGASYHFLQPSRVGRTLPDDDFKPLVA